MDKKLKKDYKCEFRQYGEIIVPKGTKVTNETATGVDLNYNFVSEFDWVDENYPAYANILKMDLENYGLNVPKEFITD